MQELNRWLLLSSMQKAIRRGCPDAAASAFLAAHTQDPFHAMYRVAISAIEDVGVGNVAVVDQLLKTALRKKDLAELGGVDFVLSTVRALASGIKDRTACDASWMASHMRVPATWFSDDNAAKNVFLNTDDTLVQRTLAAWWLMGTKKLKHGGMTGLRDFIHDIDRVCNVAQDGHMPQHALETMVASSGYHKEGHFLAYPLVAQQLSIEMLTTQSLAISALTPGDVVEICLDNSTVDVHGTPILLSAVDGHTSEGKAILREIGRERDIQSILGHLPHDRQEWHLKHALFRVEGQQVDNRLYFPSSSKIFKQARSFLDYNPRSLSLCAPLGERVFPPTVDFAALSSVLLSKWDEIQERRTQTLSNLAHVKHAKIRP